MSYILDALRRADADRSRGVVPGLHSQMPADPEPAARNYRPLIWGAGLAGVLLVAGVVILLFGPWHRAPDAGAALVAAARDSAPAPAAQGEPAAPPPGAIDPAARPVEPPISGRDALPRSAAETTSRPAYPPTASDVARSTAAAANRVATLVPRSAARPAAPAPAVEHYGPPLAEARTGAPTTANTPNKATAAAPSPAADIPRVADLPPAVRSQLPRLTVAGSVYSETPSARMVILNGQVFHEGDKPAADTVLEQIRLKSAVLNFRGQRYEISF